MYEDLEVKLPLAGITIAAAYMLMVAIDAILHQQFEAIESETNAANAETENEETKTVSPYAAVITTLALLIHVVFESI